MVSFFPLTTSSKVSDKSITVSSPLLFLPKLNPNPNGSLLFLPEKPPPNNCSKISFIPPNPISLKISSKFDSDPLKTSSDPTCPYLSYFFLFSSSDSTAYASEISLNFSSAPAFLFLSG
jgi:hypothetical protein